MLFVLKMVWECFFCVPFFRKIPLLSLLSETLGLDSSKTFFVEENQHEVVGCLKNMFKYSGSNWNRLNNIKMFHLVFGLLLSLAFHSVF